MTNIKNSLESINNVKTITSLEVAEMIGKEHSKLLRDIRTYIDQLGQAKIGQSEFFVESTYKNSQNKTQPCYLVSKKGCEFISHKLTGVKGTEFTAKYINRFHDMEEVIKSDMTVANLLLSIYNGGQDAVVASKMLTDIEVKKQTAPLIEENNVMKPKAEYHDEVLNKDGLLTTTVVAKDLGLKSAAKLNKIMNFCRIIFKNASGTWCPYADYEWLIADGYADYQSYTAENSNPCLKWTEKGRKWIIENYDKWLQKIIG